MIDISCSIFNAIDYLLHLQIIMMNYLKELECKHGDLEERLVIDTACLLIESGGKHYEQWEVWAQSTECYQCSTWYYGNVQLHTPILLAVNTTYPTTFTLYNLQGDSSRFDYHFDQYGNYKLQLAGNSTSLECITKGNNEILALLICLLVLVVLGFIWTGVSKLKKRLKESRNQNEISETAIIPANTMEDLQANDLMSEVLESRAELLSAISPPCIETQLSTPETARISSRLKSLDTFRGIAIVLMIFVNYGGGKYYFFRHARWNGLTVADLVFPWFLWIMGVSLIISLNTQHTRLVPLCKMVWKIIKRSLTLFMVGIVINSLKSNSVTTLRIPGVLQRFSFAYLIVGLNEIVFLKFYHQIEDTCYWPFRDLVWSFRQWTLMFLIGLLHTLLLFLLPVPSCPKGYLGPGGLHKNSSYFNCTGGVTGYIDKIVFGPAHIHQHPTSESVYDSKIAFDPEGILGALTSCITVHLGVTAGKIILLFKNHNACLRRWILWGIFLGVLGGFLCNWKKEDGFIPINKNLWSLSYVCVTSSMAFFLLSLCYTTIDKLHWWNGNPFRFAGLNPLLLYVGHEVTENVFPWSWSPVGQCHLSYLIMNVWGTSLWMSIAYICQRENIYLKI